MFVSYNRMELIPEPARSELIKFITQSETFNLQHERFMRRNNIYNWFIAPIMALNVLLALWRLGFTHLDSFEVGINIVTILFGTYVVRMSVRSIARYRTTKAKRPLNAWNDYVAWDEIPAKLRRGGPHAQPSRRTRKAR